MELDRLRPYSFTTFDEIISKHIYDVCRHFIQYVFTESEYLDRKLPTKWHDFRFYIRHVCLDIVLMIGLVLSFFEKSDFFRKFNQLATECYGAANFYRIISCYSVMIFGATYVITHLFYTVLTYRAHFLRTCYEFRRTMDQEVGQQARKPFIRLFRASTFLAGLSLKILILGMIYLTSLFIKVLIEKLISDQLSVIESIGMLMFLLCFELELAMHQYMFWSVVCGVFVMNKAMKNRNQDTLRLMRHFAGNAQEHHWKITLIYRKVTHIHQSVCDYNILIGVAAFVSEIIVKVDCVWALLNFARTYDMSGLMFCGIFSSMYLTLLCLYTNLACYAESKSTYCKEMYTFVADLGEVPPNRIHFTQRLNCLLKADRIVHFFASEGTLFGFTFGSKYSKVLTKLKVFESATLFVTFLLLIFKKNLRSKI